MDNLTSQMSNLIPRLWAADELKKWGFEATPEAIDRWIANRTAYEPETCPHCGGGLGSE